MAFDSDTVAHEGVHQCALGRIGTEGRGSKAIRPRDEAVLAARQEGTDLEPSGCVSGWIMGGLIGGSSRVRPVMVDRGQTFVTLC